MHNALRELLDLTRVIASLKVVIKELELCEKSAIPVTSVPANVHFHLLLLGRTLEDLFAFVPEVTDATTKKRRHFPQVKWVARRDEAYSLLRSYYAGWRQACHTHYMLNSASPEVSHGCI